MKCKHICTVRYTLGSYEVGGWVVKSFWGATTYAGPWVGQSVVQVTIVTMKEIALWLNQDSKQCCVSHFSERKVTRTKRMCDSDAKNRIDFTNIANFKVRRNRIRFREHNRRGRCRFGGDQMLRWYRVRSCWFAFDSPRKLPNFHFCPYSCKKRKWSQCWVLHNNDNSILCFVRFCMLLS